LSHQLCIAHVRNYVSRRARSILEQAEREYDEKDEKLGQLAEDLKVLKEVLEGIQARIHHFPCKMREGQRDVV
jgi:hypothetical protein